MKNRGLFYSLVFIGVLLTAALACGPVTTPTVAPTSAPQIIVVTATSGKESATAEPTKEAGPTATTAASSSALVTFTDKNKYYAIDIPGDWKHEQTTGQYGYVDTFTSPDKNALVENIVHDEGDSFMQAYKGKYALYLLNTSYSYTGKEGDIRISDDSIQQDGSERLTWTSKGGGYSGISYLETRGTAFLLFTVEWSNDHKDTYFDLLGQVISSYRKP